MNEEERREKYRAWRGRFNDAADEFVKQPDASYEDLVDLIWEKGILDHIAPTDGGERQARTEMRADLYDRASEDPELYWRVLYAVANTKETIQKNMTMMGGYTTLAVISALTELFANPELQGRLFPDAGLGSYFKVIESIAERAQSEIEARGEKPHERLIPIGAKGTLCGIPVTVLRYGADGLVELGPENYMDHARLGEKINEITGKYSSSISPRHLDPEAFHTDQ